MLKVLIFAVVCAVASTAHAFDADQAVLRGLKVEMERYLGALATEQSARCGKIPEAGKKMACVAGYDMLTVRMRMHIATLDFVLKSNDVSSEGLRKKLSAAVGLKEYNTEHASTRKLYHAISAAFTTEQAMLKKE